MFGTIPLYGTRVPHTAGFSRLLVFAHVAKFTRKAGKSHLDRLLKCLTCEQCPYANKIAKSLKVAGLDVWKDDSHIQGGAAWLQEIARGITQSKLVLNLLSDSSIEFEFVEKELIYALDTAKKKVIPLRIKDVQPPLMLANLQYVDFYRKNYKKTFEELLDLILGQSITLYGPLVLMCSYQVIMKRLSSS